MKNGYGAIRYSNGDEYVGDWLDDKKHGAGSYTWANGDKYEGVFRDDFIAIIADHFDV